MRIKRGVTSRKRHKKIAQAAKGYRGRNRTTYKTAKQAVMKAGLHAYRDRKLKKRTYRSLWIVRLNAALREFDISYAKFIHAMNKQGIVMNRKALSEMAIHDNKGFEALVKKVMSGKDAPVSKVAKPEEPAKKVTVEKSDAKKPAAKKAPAKKAPAKPAAKK
jgi:large subunit ribosomal protein L20